MSEESDQCISVPERYQLRKDRTSRLDVLLDKLTPFGDDRLYNEIPFLPLVFALGRFGKGEDLTMYTSTCNSEGRLLSVVQRRILTVRTSLPRHPYIKVLHLRLLSRSGLLVSVSTAAPAGRRRGYLLREPRLKVRSIHHKIGEFEVDKPLQTMTVWSLCSRLKLSRQEALRSRKLRP